MTAQVIDGKQIAEQTRAEAAEGARQLKAENGVVPHLAAVLVGDDPASAVYVRNKHIACEKAGFKSTLHRLPATTTQAELMALVHALNADPRQRRGQSLVKRVVHRARSGSVEGPSQAMLIARLNFARRTAPAPTKRGARFP